jgi:plastocyanin
MSTLPDVTKAMPTRRPVKLPITRLRKPMSYAAGLALVASLAACGGSSADSAETTSAPLSTTDVATGAPTQGPTQAPTQAPTRRTSAQMLITITGRKVDPAPSSVRLAVGQSLTLVVTSDHDDTLHAHGFDVEKALVAGQPTTVTLTGKAPGSYEVETHDPELRLLVVDVQ